MGSFPGPIETLGEDLVLKIEAGAATVAFRITNRVAACMLWGVLGT